MGDFLSDLPGIRDLQWEDNAPLPRRNRLVFTGAVTVTDNPVHGCTDIVFDAPIPAGDTNTYQLPLNAAAFGGEGAAPSVLTTSLFRLIPSESTVYLHGMSPALMPRLMLYNASDTSSIVLMHESAQAEASDMRIACPSRINYTLRPNSMLMLIRDPVSQCWRVVQ